MAGLPHYHYQPHIMGSAAAAEAPRPSRQPQPQPSPAAPIVVHGHGAMVAIPPGSVAPSSAVITAAVRYLVRAPVALATNPTNGTARFGVIAAMIDRDGAKWTWRPSTTPSPERKAKIPIRYVCPLSVYCPQIEDTTHCYWYEHSCPSGRACPQLSNPKHCDMWMHPCAVRETADGKVHCPQLKNRDEPSLYHRRNYTHADTFLLDHPVNDNKQIGDTFIQVCRGDIAYDRCEVLVIPQHTSLDLGSKTGAAVAHLAGDGLRQECMELVRKQQIQSGRAYETQGHLLEANIVLHAVVSKPRSLSGSNGPPSGVERDAALNALANITHECLTVCLRRPCRSIAFPLLRAGDHISAKDCFHAMMCGIHYFFVSGARSIEPLEVIRFVIHNASLADEVQLWVREALSSPTSAFAGTSGAAIPSSSPSPLPSATPIAAARQPLPLPPNMPVSSPVGGISPMGFALNPTPPSYPPPSYPSAPVHVAPSPSPSAASSPVILLCYPQSSSQYEQLSAHPSDKVWTCKDRLYRQCPQRVSPPHEQEWTMRDVVLHDTKSLSEYKIVGAVTIQITRRPSNHHSGGGMNVPNNNTNGPHVHHHPHPPPSSLPSSLPSSSPPPSPSPMQVAAMHGDAAHARHRENDERARQRQLQQQQYENDRIAAASAAAAAVQLQHDEKERQRVAAQQHQLYLDGQKRQMLPSLPSSSATPPSPSASLPPMMSAPAAVPVPSATPIPPPAPIATPPVALGIPAGYGQASAPAPVTPSHYQYDAKAMAQPAAALVGVPSPVVSTQLPIPAPIPSSMPMVPQVSGIPAGYGNTPSAVVPVPPVAVSGPLIAPLPSSSSSSTNGIQFMTWNILSYRYSQPKWYPYCRNGELDWSHRSGVLLQNIATFNADVLCLQEVDKEFPAMAAARFGSRYTSIYAQKKGRDEGLLTLFDAKLFRLEKNMILHLPHNEHGGQVALFAVLERLNSGGEGNGKKVIVINTHLLGDPTLEHQRVAQLEYIMKVGLPSAQSQFAIHHSIPTILCGDFNTDPSLASYAYMQSLQVPISLPSAPPLTFVSAAPQYIPGTREPECTFRSEAKARTLDYIWYTPSSLTLGPCPPAVPGITYSTTDVPIPTRTFGSDHLPIRASFII